MVDPITTCFLRSLRREVLSSRTIPAAGAPGGSAAAGSVALELDEQPATMAKAAAIAMRFIRLKLAVKREETVKRGKRGANVVQRLCATIARCVRMHRASRAGCLPATAGAPASPKSWKRSYVSDGVRSFTRCAITSA